MGWKNIILKDFSEFPDVFVEAQPCVIDLVGSINKSANETQFVGIRTQSPVLQRTFRRELVKELVRNSGISHSLTPRGRPRRSAEGLTRLQVGGHFPEKILGTGKKSNITRACVVCFPAQKKILKRTGDKRKRPGKESSFQCSVCKVALCMQDCFQLYHTVEDYVAAYIRRHDANNDNVDAETN